MPADDVFGREDIGNRADEFFVSQLAIDGTGRIQLLANFCGTVIRPQIAAVHLVPAIGATRLAQMLMPDHGSRTQRTAGITGGGLDPDVFKGTFTQQAAIGHTVECHAAGQAEVFFAGIGMQRAGKTQHHFFGHGLNGCRQIHLALCDR